MENKFEELLQSENQHIEKLNELVMEAVKEEQLISDKLYEFEDKHPAFTSRLRGCDSILKGGPEVMPST